MLREDWDDHGGIFRPLALVNGRRVGRHQHIEFTESVFDGSAVEANSNFPRIDVDIVDGADVAVVPFAARMRRIALTMVVLPTPGPPVMTSTLDISASRIAAT